MLHRRDFLETVAAVTAGLGAKTLMAADGSGASPKSAVPTIDQEIGRYTHNAPLGMRFTGTSAEECRRWQAAFSKKLRSLLGPFDPPARWTNMLERTVRLEDHVREERLLVADGLQPVPIYVMLPLEQPAAGRFPALLALHGHGLLGYDAVAGRDDSPEMHAEIDRSHYDYGRQLVRRGYMVVAPCLTPFGRRLSPELADRKRLQSSKPCADVFIRLQFLGKLLIAENLRDVLWALAYLAQRPEADAERIGCVGLSYGGRMTMLATALEPRIRVAVISGALNCFQERIGNLYDCGAQTIPGLLQYGDVPEIASLIAPRPCLWEVGLQDEGLPAEWAQRAWQRISAAYQALDASGRLHIDRFDGGHVWHGEAAYPFISAALSGAR